MPVKTSDSIACENQSNTMVKAKKAKGRNKSSEVPAPIAHGAPADMEVDDDPASSPPKTKRKKLEENRPSNINDHSTNDSSGEEMSDDEDEVPSPGKANEETKSFGRPPFDAKDFRKKLFSRNGGVEMKIFASMVKDSSEEYISKYFDAGGSANEILEALAESKQRDPGSAMAAIRILRSLFLNVLKFHPERLAECEEAALKLTQSASSFLNSLLSPKQNANKVVTGLQMLTAMVSLSPAVAKEVLRVISLGKDEVRRLTNRSDDPNEKSEGSSKIRKCYLHFLMAFLVDKEANTIQLVMAKEGLIGTAMLGLMYDPADLVHLVLTTVRTNIVENTHVAKRLKQNTFNTKILEALVVLYEWQGPASKRFSRNKRGKIQTLQKVSEDSLALVQGSVHLFFKSLLTSFKLGVVFPSPSADVPLKHNMQAFTVLRKLQRPWDCDLKSDLMISVLKSCPTLVRMVLSIYADLLMPRPTLTWLRTLEFVIKLLDSITIDGYTPSNDVKITPKMLSNMIINLTLPVGLLKQTIAPGLSHSHAGVREATSRLLVCIFSRLNHHLARAQEMLEYSDEALELTRSFILQQLSNILPPATQVWEAWKAAISIKEVKAGQQPGAVPAVQTPSISGDEMPKQESMGLQDPSQASQLATYLILLLGYQQWLPHWLEIGWGGGKTTKVLSSIKMALDLLDEGNHEMAGHLRVKAICLISSMDSMAIAPNEEFFSWAIDILVNGAADIPEARVALNKILVNLGIMQENEDELMVWIWSCKKRKDCQELLSTALIFLAKNLIDYTEKQYELISNKAMVTKSHSMQLDELLEELENESHSSGPIFTNPHRDVAFSPLLVVMLQLLHEKAFKNYSERLKILIPRATIKLLYHQSCPNYLLSLVKAKLKDFPGDFELLLKDQDHMLREYLYPDEINLVEYLDGTRTKLAKFQDTDDEKLKQMFKLVIFNCSSKVNKENFDRAAVSKYQTAIKAILAIMTVRTRQSCLEMLICHPVLLNAYSLHSSTTSNQCLSEFLIGIIPLLKERLALASIRQKTLHGLKKSFSKDGSNIDKLSWCDHEKIGDLVLSLNLDSGEVHSLLKVLFKLEQKFWTLVNGRSLPVCLLSSLLKRILLIRDEDNQEDIAAVPLNEAEMNSCLAIFENILQLMKQKRVVLTNFESTLLEYLTIYPHHVKTFSADLAVKILNSNSTHSLSLARLLLQWAPVDSKALLIWMKNSELQKALPLLQTLVSRKHSGVEKMECLVYESFQAKLIETLEQLDENVDDSWFTENKDTVAHLVDKYLDEKQFPTKTLKPLKDKVTALPWVAELVCKVFISRSKSLPILASWIIRSATITLSGGNSEQSRAFCSLLDKVLSVNQKDNVLSETSDQSLLEFCKAVLKRGIGEDNILLGTLANVVSQVQNEAALQSVLSMLLSHSQSMPILLGHEEEKKIGILRLLDTLTDANKSLISAKHVPVLLGAYQASLTCGDQIIYKLLLKYERNGVSFQELQPLLWSEAAITRYSLKSHMGQSLRNLPSPSHVMHALDPSRVAATLANFPVNRGLDGISEPLTGFKVYDPAFYLPLLAQILLPEVHLQTWLFTRNAFPLTLVALASDKEDTRNLAQLIVSRFYFHAEAGRMTFEKKLWLHFVDTVRRTVVDAKDQKLPLVVALFLARSSQIISNPEHELYHVLNKFLLAKQAIDTDTLPEFLRMMHSSDPGHRTLRVWMLNLLKDGMKTNKDFELFFSSFAFKILTCLYNSAIADTRLKIDVLQVLTSVVQVPGAVKRLSSSSGFMSWIHGTIADLPPAPANDSTDCIISEAIIVLLSTLWKTSDLVEIKESVLFSVVLLLDKIPAQQKLLCPLVELLVPTFKDNEASKIIFTDDHLKNLLGLCKRAGISNYPDCMDLLCFKVTGDSRESNDKLGKMLIEFLNIWLV